MKIETDRYGTPLMGDDDLGFWWGTRARPLTIEDYDTDGRIHTRKRRFFLSGFLLGEPFEAYIHASSADRAENYFRNIGVRDVKVWVGFP